jgi:hypothetical protein
LALDIEFTLAGSKTASFFSSAAVINAPKIVTFSRLYNTGRTTGVQTMPKSVPFKQVLNAYLQDPEKAMSYLRSALEENDPVLFEAVMQDVIKAQGPSGRLMPFLTKLADSLQRDGAEEEMIKAIVAEMSESFVDAA